MIRVLVIIFVSLLPFSLNASDEHMAKSKGIDQESILSLYPVPSQVDVPQNAVIKVQFKIPLDPSSVQKHNVKLVDLSSHHHEHIRGNIAYDKDQYLLTYTPSKLLQPGFYEVEIKSLKAAKTHKQRHIHEIKYHFYVPEVVNGYALPPEPDKKLNDSTLLGIDFNNNGIRDDVERLVIIEESKNSEYPKTQIAISMQYAWAWQKIIDSPTLEARKYLENASSCQWYWFAKKTKDIEGYVESRKWRKEHIGKLGVELEDKIFNTKERTLQRFKFNEACSGQIFSLPKDTIENCQINIDELGE
ncbi:hypothetical protein [Sulfurimonas sp. HSL-1716]|uniref:hypothetical protein n=1 Tax=Hydrocurvibacter sulfurireducens TaxID=3131937 RepID=UPI0031F79ECE